MFLMPLHFAAAQMVPFGFFKAQAPVACVGAMVGGYCWLMTTTSSESCTTRCSSHGGVHNATRYYAGSYGSSANCQAVLVALGETVSSMISEVVDVGCYRGNTSGRLVGSIFTTYSAGANSGGASRRACACNNFSDPQPAINEVTGLAAVSSNSNSAVLEWNLTGGGNAGYRIAYQTGATAPTDCTSASVLESAITSPVSSGKHTHIINGLSASTTYSFRVCASNASASLSLSAGQTLTITTSVSDSGLIAKRPLFTSVLGFSPADGSTSVTQSFSTSGTNRFLIVNIADRLSNANDVTAVTYGGTALTKIVSQKGDALTHDLWVLVNPSSGANNIVITKTTGSLLMHVSAAQYSGVNQTSPYTDLSKNTYTAISGAQANTFASTQDKLIVLSSGYMHARGFYASSNLTLNSSTNSAQATIRYYSIGGDASIYISSYHTNSQAGGYSILELNPIP